MQPHLYQPNLSASFQCLKFGLAKPPSQQYCQELNFRYINSNLRHCRKITWSNRFIEFKNVAKQFGSKIEYEEFVIGRAPVQP
jgi:hypothetical protein